jgi:hypothetical protein
MTSSEGRTASRQAIPDLNRQGRSRITPPRRDGEAIAKALFVE